MRLRPRIVAFWQLIALLLLASGPAGAIQSFNVNTTTDAPDATPGDGTCESLTGECTLRAAIMEANALPGPQSLAVPAGEYLVDIPYVEGQLEEAWEEDSDAVGDLDVTDTLEINGAGVDKVWITAPPDGGLVQFRAIWGPLFHVQARTVLRDLAVGGKLGAFRVVPMPYLSGVIHVEDQLELLRVLVSDTTSDGVGGIQVNAGNLILRDSSITRTNGELSGIFVWGGGTALVTSSDIWNNSSYNAPLLVLPGSEMTIEDSRLEGNSCGNIYCVISGGNGGSSGKTLVRNSVITGSSGPGILHLGPGSRLQNVTISDNTSTFLFPVVSAASDVVIKSSTIVQNELQNPQFDTFAVQGGLVGGSIIASNVESLSGDNLDCADIVSVGYNLFGSACENSTLLPTDRAGTLDVPLDPVLGLLADNGGPTPTHALLRGSPAIDRIPTAACTWLTKDQRGGVRPREGDGAPPSGCDSGAYEVAACADGLDNDGDGRIDFDGGATAGITPLGSPDPSCGSALGNVEAAAGGFGCGLGPELMPAMLLVRIARRRFAARKRT